jgi:pimeloyl-ACP methyl ester carboxylesterase
LLTSARPAARIPLRRSFGAPRWPSFRRALAVAAVLLLAASASTVVSTLAYLRLPAPTGSLAVGRMDVLLSDPARQDPRSGAGAARQVRLITWYPAETSTAEAAPYVPGLEAIREGLVASGEVGALEASGLEVVRANARAGAPVAAMAPRYPVVLLSPGNATNVAFYGSLAEELASHGYVVVGIDHPYQVAAVDLGHGAVAVYAGDEAGAPGAGVAAKIDERVADIAFVLDRLAADGAGMSGLTGRLDLTRVAVAGHSNGGIAAAEACALDDRVVACLNIDGQAAGGPFSAHPTPQAPTKPFLYLTKEREVHPALAALFERGGDGTFRVVVPAAAHGDFGDTSRFVPRLAPLDGTPDAVLTIERGFALAFLDHVLRGAPVSRFGSVTAPSDVEVSVYPLGDPEAPRQTIP